jgi:hypothetical protein
MGDPGLVAVDLVDVALAHRARLQRGEIGAGIRLGEHRRRQHFAGGDLRQPFALLLLGAAAENQLGRDLGAGAERADADIAARQLLGDDAHRFLAEPHAAVILGDGEAEHAELGHLRDDIERDVLVAQMPFLRMRHDLDRRRICASPRGSSRACPRARRRRPSRSCCSRINSTSRARRGAVLPWR